MLDRSNANFLLWPPCVEVQRCSGCCNAKSLQCVPFVTHTRYLQVVKIEYVNKKPTYTRVVVSVVDHVECRCQAAPRAPMPKKKSPHKHHGHQHRNQTLSQEHGHEQVKVHSKDELHQWDELKQNQRSHPEDLLEHHWNPRGDTFSQSEGYSLAGEEASRSGETPLLTPHWAHNSTGPFGTKDQNLENKNGGISGAASADNVDMDAGNKVEEGGDGLLLNRTEGRANEATQSPSQQEDKSKFPNSHTGGSFQTVTPNPQYNLSPAEATGDRSGSMFRPTKEPNPEPRQLGRRRDNETPEETTSLQAEQKKAEQEREELLLLHKRLDQEKEILRKQQMKHEEEERQQETKAEGQPHGKPYHHLHTTQTPATTSTTMRPRPPPVNPRLPVRPRRRMRKNRKRISKAAMRAMLM